MLYSVTKKRRGQRSDKNAKKLRLLSPDDVQTISDALLMPYLRMVMMRSTGTMPIHMLSRVTIYWPCKSSPTSIANNIKQTRIEWVRVLSTNLQSFGLSSFCNPHMPRPLDRATEICPLPCLRTMIPSTSESMHVVGIHPLSQPFRQQMESGTSTPGGYDPSTRLENKMWQANEFIIPHWLLHQSVVFRLDSVNVTRAAGSHGDAKYDQR